jgi:PhnB protein
MTYKPSGYNDLSAYLIVNGAGKLMPFLKAAFGAKELRLYGQSESIAHAEVRIGDSVLMLADATDQWPAVRSVLHVYVPDADEAYQRALAAGGTAVQVTQTVGRRSRIPSATCGQWERRSASRADDI